MLTSIAMFSGNDLYCLENVASAKVLRQQNTVSEVHGLAIVERVDDTVV